MNEVKVNGEDLVFGLDIGTRSVVGQWVTDRETDLS